jgi:pimeloyl-ACP methyl ester carboxylesterase
MSALQTMMPEPRHAEANGIRMAYWEVGPRRGTPVVFCHGFPELAFSWRHQLKACEAAGRRAIAPDQRGYGLTSRPEAAESYDMAHLTGDLAGLLDHLGIEKAVFCGHDWGGAIVWRMPLLHPDRTAGVIGVNTPHRRRPSADPISIYRQRMGEQMYQVHFQKPGEADAILARDVARTMSFFLRRPPPAMRGAGPGLAGGGSSFPLVRMVEAYDPAADPRENFLSPEEMAVFVESFSRTGFTGGINWYRNITRNWQAAEGMDETVRVPSLMIMAELDSVLPPSSADGMEAYVPDLEKVLIKGSGHWTQQEKPAETSAAILDWLERRFP